MSYLAFEHAIAVKNPLKREIMKMGSGGEIVHVEFILPTFHNLRASSWNGFGVGLKTEQVNFSEFVVYDLGNFDQAIYNYFVARQGQKYDLKGLFTTMILKMNPAEKDRFFCSEIVVEVLQNIVGLTLPPLVPSQVSPNDLYKIVSQMGLAQIYL